MGAQLRAFISYRRMDTFMGGRDPSVERDYAFIEKLTEVLKQVGVGEVFVDTNETLGIRHGEDYEGRIHDEITNCDIFVELVGNDWLDILKDKAEAGEPDILVKEIRAALRLEKVVIPILLDGAQMPARKDLPEDIQNFHTRNAISASSRELSEKAVTDIAKICKTVTGQHVLGRLWKNGYIAAGLLSYFLCAVLPHVVGVWEYGLDAWTGMALVWSGFFVWPVFLFPLSLLALYYPLTTIARFASSATRHLERLRYLTPVILATVLAILATFVEVLSEDQVPWTVVPALSGPGCAGGADTSRQELVKLSSYGQTAEIQKHYKGYFWLKNKCWPNAFFYLTTPVYQHKYGEAYKVERRAVQSSFREVLKTSYGAPYSYSYYVYAISFYIMIWFLAIGVTLSVFYLISYIRRPQDSTILKNPSEDAYFCLTYAMLNLIMWVPFRMNTVYFKSLYQCAELGLASCTLEPKAYARDVILGLVFFIGFMFMTGALLVKYRRIMVTVWGVFSVMLIFAITYIIVNFGAEVATLSTEWFVQVGFLIPVILLFYALWSRFDPTIIRFNDFQKESR